VNFAKVYQCCHELPIVFLGGEVLKRQYFEEECFKPDTVGKVSAAKPGEFIDCEFIGVDLQQYSFKSSRFVNCSFNQCNISNVEVTGSTFIDPHFTNCKVAGVNFASCNEVRGPQFINSLLDYSVFQGQGCEHIFAQDCSFKDADFSDANIKNSLFSNCNFLNANFNGADLRGSDLRTATNYRINPGLSKIKGAKFSLPEAMSLLDGFEIILE
jgi:fluoroquinolone resistance protein